MDEGLLRENQESLPALGGMIARARRAPRAPLPDGAQRALGFGIVISAVRCTLQYVVLPFVLPWIGVAASIPPWLTLGLSAVALASLARNVRILWRTRHARRWSYLFTAGVIALALLVFTVVDVRALVH